MNARLSRVILEAILSQANNAGDEECCGLLLAHPASPHGLIDAILPAANIAPDPRRFFEIDPAKLIAAHRTKREGGPHIVGCYHSHPGGNPMPSAEDAAQADAASGWLWLICAGPPWDATLWRAGPTGTIHNRFEQVSLIVEPAP